MKELVNDEFGNFVIQQIFNLNLPEQNKQIFDFMAANIIFYSKQKFSSNIIDKCLLSPNSQFAERTIDLLIQMKAVSHLIVDQYGNYSNYDINNLVIQKSLQITKGVKFLQIIDSIKKVIHILKTSSTGRKILDILLKSHGEYFNKTQYLKRSTTTVVKKNNYQNS